MLGRIQSAGSDIVCIGKTQLLCAPVHRLHKALDAAVQPYTGGIGSIVAGGQQHPARQRVQRNHVALHQSHRGAFHLDGIAPAPRGVPQIEVTFDIDANGIVHVSAKDLGTGKEQSITITASTNMSKDDIDKAVKDAEQYAAEDKKRREDVDARNNADQMVFQTEKALGELGDKVSPSEKSECEAKLNALKEALKGTDIEAIKAKQDDLQKAFYAISEKVYQQAAQQQGQQPGADAQQGPTGNAGSAPKDDGAVDADFHEV